MKVKNDICIQICMCIELSMSIFGPLLKILTTIKIKTTYVKKYNNENNNFTQVLGITHNKHDTSLLVSSCYLCTPVYTSSVTHGWFSLVELRCFHSFNSLVHKAKHCLRSAHALTSVIGWTCFSHYFQFIVWQHRWNCYT